MLSIIKKKKVINWIQAYSPETQNLTATKVNLIVSVLACLTGLKVKESFMIEVLLLGKQTEIVVWILIITIIIASCFSIWQYFTPRSILFTTTTIKMY